MYNVVIMCVFGAVISFILSDQQDVSFIIISIFIIFCTTGTLCLVFVPKVIVRRLPRKVAPRRSQFFCLPNLLGLYQFFIARMVFREVY